MGVFFSGRVRRDRFRVIDLSTYGNSWRKQTKATFEARIVLTWGDFPNDLDSHLTYYMNGTKYLHAYYSSRSAYFNGQKVMYLDMDDTTSYGPETITVSLKEEYLQNGEFKYSVHNYTNRGSLNSSALSSSNAVVHVYKGNELLKTYHVPKNNVGTVWHVLDLTKDGVVSYNEFTNVTNPEYVN